MGGEQSEAQRLAFVPLLQQLGHRHDVAEALRHLLGSGHREEAVVKPETGERHAVMRAAALGDLILMMRKDEVEAAGVDVDRLAQMRLDHRRAFDVPAGAARSEEQTFELQSLMR